MIVAGIDPSLSSTGIAVLVDGHPVMLRTVGHRSPDARSYAHRSDRIVSQARAVIDALYCAPVTSPADRPKPLGERIDMAVIEGPAYAHHNAGTHDSAGLWWGLFSKLRSLRIPTAVIAPKTRALWTTGNGNATKSQVLDTVRSWWPGHAIRCNDIADALALASIGAAHFGDQLPFELRARHRAKLRDIDWPEVRA
ncbi:Crossover junction endodeoxyribonuclease RuvC [Mycobacterium shimoidei]|uniref:Crossover junction endodeoxyribonuclease RuvC n=1 Tax=Mycobacterium shimoidei TaxID=29313 RepID=A0A375YXG8_MYCSH|nr:hypothetical protein [Mycobacterium shimoidei]SRX93578.1 Crossover junction endodeoxyribonuclease RuvC [Mycobacterium shimoidei]